MLWIFSFKKQMWVHDSDLKKIYRTIHITAWNDEFIFTSTNQWTQMRTKQNYRRPITNCLSKKQMIFHSVHDIKNSSKSGSNAFHYKDKLNTTSVTFTVNWLYTNEIPVILCIVFFFYLQSSMAGKELSTYYSWQNYWVQTTEFKHHNPNNQHVLPFTFTQHICTNNAVTKWYNENCTFVQNHLSCFRG